MRSKKPDKFSHKDWDLFYGAPKTPGDCWCLHYNIEYKRHRYWHRAFCISMFFNGLFGMPWIAAIIAAVVKG